MLAELSQRPHTIHLHLGMRHASGALMYHLCEERQEVWTLMLQCRPSTV